MDTKATATLIDGQRIAGRLTTDHAASSYGRPVFVGDDGRAYDWIAIANISTASELGRMGGSSTSKAKTKAARANGKKGGRPKKQKLD